MKLILTGACSLVLAGCVTDSGVPVTSAPSTAAYCQAMGSAFPLHYHSKTDSADTMKGIDQANARFNAVCS